MKLLLSAIIILVASLQNISAQWRYENIPSAVSASFEKQFPKINPQEVDWDWKSEGYEATFFQNGNKHKGYFDHNGGFLSYEVFDIEPEELPIDLALALKYSPYETWEIEHINELHKKEDTLYEIEVRNGKHDEKVYYSRTGTRVSKEDYKKGQI